jgi:hypothetical protein
MWSENTRRHAVQDAANPRPYPLPNAWRDITGRTKRQPPCVEAWAPFGRGGCGAAAVQGADDGGEGRVGRDSVAKRTSDREHLFRLDRLAYRLHTESLSARLAWFFIAYF